MSQPNGLTAPVLVAADPPADADSGEDRVNVVPCTIHVVGYRKFVVNDIGAWAYHEHGVFASGYWDQRDVFGDGAIVDVLIPFNRIDYTELHFDRLES